MWDLAVKIGTITATYDLVKDVMATACGVVSTILNADFKTSSWTLPRDGGTIRWRHSEKGECFRLHASEEVLVIFRRGIDSIGVRHSFRSQVQDPALWPGQRMIVSPLVEDQIVHFPSDSECAIVPVGEFNDVCNFLFEEMQVMLEEQRETADNDLPYVDF